METSENTDRGEYNAVYITIILLMAFIGLCQTLFVVVATYKTRSRNYIPKFVMQLYLTNILNFLVYVLTVVFAIIDDELVIEFKKWIEFGLYYVTCVRFYLPLALSVYHFTMMYSPFEWTIVRKWLGAVLSLSCWILPFTTMSIFFTVCDFDDNNFRWMYGKEMTYVADKCVVISFTVLTFRWVMTFGSFVCDCATLFLCKDSLTMDEYRLMHERLASMFGLVLFMELLALIFVDATSQDRTYKFTPDITIGLMLVLYVYPMVFIARNTKQRAWMRNKWRSWTKKTNIIMVAPAPASGEPSAAK